MTAIQELTGRETSKVPVEEVPEGALTLVREYDETSISFDKEAQQEIEERRTQEYQKLLDDHDKPEDELGSARLQDYERRALNEAKNQVLDEHEGEKCPVEMREVQHFFSLFEDYDLDNPKVWMPVRSLLNMVLSSIRLQLKSTAEGVTRMEAGGDEISEEVVPWEKTKLKYDKAIVRTTKDLFKMLEGEKVTVQHDHSISDVMERMRQGEDIIDVEPENE